MTETRFQLPDGQKLGYEKQGSNLWRIMSIDPGSPPAAVGPHYKTKAELLADLDRYAKEFGF